LEAVDLKPVSLQKIKPTETQEELDRAHVEDSTILRVDEKVD
jgi:titin